MGSQINDTWRDHSPLNGYPIVPVGRRVKVVAPHSAGPEPRYRVIARWAAQTGALACYVAAGVWVLSFTPLL
jgi:hypothetical protein